MDNLVMLVAPGNPLPQPGKKCYAPSPLSGVVYEVDVRSIKKLDWNRDGNLLVTMNATKRMLKGALPPNEPATNRPKK